LQVAQAEFIKGEKNCDRLCEIVQNHLANNTQLKLDYVQILQPLTLQPLKSISETALLAIAVYLGKTRLIDNILLTNQPQIC
jgi:pantothenate synthetase